VCVAPPDPSMVSSATAQSRQLPQSVRPPWILTHLDSLSSLHSPVSVKTTDGAPLPVVGQSTLYTSSFHVSYVSHVPQSTLFLLARLLIMVVVSFLILTFVLFRIVALGLWLVLVVGSVILLVFGCLTGYTFLQLLFRAGQLSLLMSLLLSFLLPPALLSGIII
jgi:hypothetical protein